MFARKARQAAHPQPPFFMKRLLIFLLLLAPLGAVCTANGYDPDKKVRNPNHLQKKMRAHQLKLQRHAARMVHHNRRMYARL